MGHYNPANDPEVTGGKQEAFGFKIGDVVEYTNDNGAKFSPRKIIGFVPGRKQEGKRTIYLNKDAPWYAVRPDQLRLLELT